jgi:hypothetical protein
MKDHVNKVGKYRNKVNDPEFARMDYLKESDFPPGTLFFVKGTDGAYAVFPGDGPYKFRTFAFPKGVKSPVPATGVNLSGYEVSVDEFLKEVAECAAVRSSKNQHQLGRQQ